MLAVREVEVVVRWWVPALLGLLLLVTPASAVVLDPPVPGPVVAGFHAPTRYGPGHRGVDLVALPGTPVRAPAAGHVTFAGQVAGSTWVTVDHGVVRTTVGPLRSVRVTAGTSVLRGDVLGTSGRAHDRDLLHWSARRGTTYVDPLRVGRLVASLVPLGQPGEPAATTWPRARVR